MTTELMALLSDQTNSFINQVKGNIVSSGSNATGESAKSIVYEITETQHKITITVLGKPYFSVLETGRKATPGVKPGRAMIENIQKWCAVKGKPESAAWGIATNIQKHGTKLFQKGGRTDIYTDLKEGFADKIFMEVTENLASEFFRQAQVAFK